VGLILSLERLLLPVVMLVVMFVEKMFGNFQKNKDLNFLRKFLIQQLVVLLVTLQVLNR
jgi:hypothetical protein